MSNPTMVTLARHLVTMSEQGELDWEKTETAGVYQLPFPDYAVRITSDKDEDGWDVYEIQLFSERGTLMDTFSSMDARRVGVISGGVRAMQELYESARRQAEGVHEALAQILENLGAEETEGGALLPEDEGVTDDDIPF